MAERYFGINPELNDYFDEEEIDNIRAFLAYILMKDTGMDKDLIYNLVFHDGNNIIWH